jgi:hypothetical protein
MGPIARRKATELKNIPTNDGSGSPPAKQTPNAPANRAAMSDVPNGSAMGGPADPPAQTEPADTPVSAGTGDQLVTAVLGTGGRFVLAISAILTVVGLYGLGNDTVIAALVTLCILAAMTMLTAAGMRRK